MRRRRCRETVPLCSGGRTESAHQVSLPRPNLGECEGLRGLSNRSRARQEPIDMDQADRHSSGLSEGRRFLAAQGEYECFHYSPGWSRHADHRVPELRNPERASSRGNRWGGNSTFGCGWALVWCQSVKEDLTAE